MKGAKTQIESILWFIQNWPMWSWSWFLPEQFNSIVGKECDSKKSDPTQKIFLWSFTISEGSLASEFSEVQERKKKNEDNS